MEASPKAVQPLDWRRDHFGEGAELRQQLLCQRLDVLPRYGAKQDQLEHFVIVERITAGLEESLPQAGAMAVEMRSRLGGLRGFRAFVAAGHRSIMCAASPVARPTTKDERPLPRFAMAASASPRIARRRRA